MVHTHNARIHVGKRERRTAHRAHHSQPPANLANQLGLARSKMSFQQDQISRAQRGRKPTANQTESLEIHARLEHQIHSCHIDSYQRGSCSVSARVPDPSSGSGETTGASRPPFSRTSSFWKSSSSTLRLAEV